MGKPLRIGLVFDLRRVYLQDGYSPEQVAEFDSDETIDALETTIASLGYAVERVGTAKQLAAALVAGKRWDLVFNIAESIGGRCREAFAPAILELYGIPYTFSDPLVCAATLDKAVAKRLVAAANLPTPAYAVIETPDHLQSVRLPFPLFAKPIAEGTGKGIDTFSRIDTPEQLNQVCRMLLQRYRQSVLVEQYLAGREFTVGILGTGKQARVLGTLEIRVKDPSAPPIYSFLNKEQCETRILYLPVTDAPALKNEVEQLALAAYRALECRDAGRVDIRCDQSGKPYFLEVNPLAGLHPTHSDLPMIATSVGMSYPELIGAIIDSAKQRLTNV